MIVDDSMEFGIWIGLLQLDFGVSEFGFELLDLECPIWDLGSEDFRFWLRANGFGMMVFALFAFSMSDLEV